MFKGILSFVLLAISVSAESSESDYSEAFIAAGFEKIDSQWVSDCGKTSLKNDWLYDAGVVDRNIDLNGDSIPEILIIEGGTFCAGNTGIVTYILQHEKNEWSLVTKFVGHAEILNSRSSDGWLDIMVGGPGFCFDVKAYSGGRYKLDRTEYDGKPCKH